jgi:hypothetical protein
MMDEVEEFNLLMSHYAFTISACSRNAGAKAVGAAATPSGVSCWDVFQAFVKKFSL